jgi:NADP-dependent 3-hydroxy acid dehydrogenase YdfG
MSLTDRDMDEIVAVVVKSVVYGMQAILPHFQERGQGHLIKVSSFLGRVPLVSHRSI